MFSRTALTVRLYLYHKHYVLSFLSFGPISGRGEIPNNRGAGVSGCLWVDQWACASRRLWWELFGGLRTTADGRVFFQRSARSGRGVASGLEWGWMNRGRLRSLQESDVSLQQILQASRAAHGQ